MADRIVVPKGRPADGPASGTTPVREEVDLARLLSALQTMDKNADERIKGLRLFLFSLPFIWGVIWGLVYLIINAYR